MAKDKKKDKKKTASSTAAAADDGTADSGSNMKKEEQKSASSASTTDTSSSSSGKQSNMAVYGGILVAVLAVLAAVVYQSSRNISPEQMELISTTASTTVAQAQQVVLGNYQHYFGNILELLDDPGINTTRFRETWNNIQTSIRTASESSSKSSAIIGHRMALERVDTTIARHPVFMVPGFVTSGLELWEGHDCAVAFFRRKIWGSLETFRSFAQDSECWKQHLSLDPITGLDPDGIRLRPSQGFESADFWTSAFWVWDRVIRNLAAVGYDGSNMDMVSYDWRLSYPLMQQRDGHFSKLKTKIESFVDFSGKKAVIMGHSMGAPKVFFFLVWVGKPKEEGGGGGGDDWVERYIHAYVDLAGPLLGIPKAASALLSGEMKDTNMLNPVGSLIEGTYEWQLDEPGGGDDIWGVAADVNCGPNKVLRGNHCVDKQSAGEPTLTPFLTFTDTEVPQYESPLVNKFAAKATWSFKDVMEYLSEWKQGHHGPESLTTESLGDWNDPTKSGLPFAPSLNVYCMYGVGLPTERIFHYRRQEFVDGEDVPFVMNDTIKDDPSESLMWSVRTAIGDGTVPLVSLGYMCAEGWKQVSKEAEANPLNPGNSRIVTREYEHRGSFQVDDPMRQGPESSEHCDLLGNYEALEDMIKIALGETVEPRIVSNIEEITEQVRANKRRRQLEESK
ncbi:Phospholipid:diacylglycerol acyltransferase [Seminavis robusta]|uniref:Phospholipid:diacylglycerol acyltransferase n=1 Tax=Seminavis robusta TaxID=568900 RepID=A0A9N8EUE1_9STRA|nr:Phospholipid:diacylglycerol acyltransferase [Seminavis robusta]|eukprot:Sro1717_g293230.1 Phospholipid:diacylglycerol acyltransferase (677) ;mRNA; r:1217-3384